MLDFTKTKQKSSNLLVKLGVGFVFFSFVLAVVFFYPVLLQEVRYYVSSFFRFPGEMEVVVSENRVISPDKEKDVLIPKDTDFGIVIPKINANASVVSNVDPLKPELYQKALTKGVAHAEGTVFPGQIGNTFIFSHSSVNFYEASRYNSIFYLLNKLKESDDFYLIYKGKSYKYSVIETKIVNADQIEYMKSGSIVQGESAKTATLMTCWPLGTTLKRYIVVGKLIESN